MDVHGQSLHPGAGLDQWAYWGGGNQQFVIRRGAGGHYTFASLNSLDPIEVPGFAGPAAGQPRQSEPGGAGQQWSFLRA